MIVQSAVYGPLEISEEEVVTFVHGIPGFESLTRFAIAAPEGVEPFRIMQSLEQPEISFILTSPYHFFPDYDFQLPEAVQEDLSIEKPDDIEVWNIVTVRGQIQDATVNLLAPIIVNRKKRIGRQAILNESGYQLRHRIYPEQPAASAAEG